MDIKYLKQELKDWTKVGAFVFLGGFLLWNFSVHQANKVDYAAIGVEVIPELKDIVEFKSSLEYVGSNNVVAPELPEIAYVPDAPLPALEEEVILDEILPYNNPTVDDLPPVTEDGSHLPDIPAIIL